MSLELKLGGNKGIYWSTMNSHQCVNSREVLPHLVNFPVVLLAIPDRQRESDL